MKEKDIDTLISGQRLAPHVLELRKHAPHYLRWIIEKTSAFPEFSRLDDLAPGSIQALGGGNSSAVYRIQYDKRSFVVKLRPDGLEAEVESLRAWAREGVAVPEVVRQGVVSPEKNHPIKYLVLGLVVDKNGEQAPTGTEYLHKHPRRAKSIGRLMGRTLARVHRAKSQRTFGEFSDRIGSNKSPFKSWNRYLLGYIPLHRSYLLGIGVSRHLLKVLGDAIRQMPFAARGTYLHGDYSVRNIMVTASRMPQLAVFDPNPMIGDPSWDVAVLFNNRDYARNRYEIDPANQEYRSKYWQEQNMLEVFWDSYRRASKEEISIEQVRLNQLIQTFVHLRVEAEKPGSSKGEQKKKVQARREVLFERFGGLHPV